MHLTQTAVSIQLKNIQSQFKIPLIEIIIKRVYITDFGKDIADSAQNIMNQVIVIDNRLTKYRWALTDTQRMSSFCTAQFTLPGGGSKSKSPN
jgi:DNA-binding transcriptional LysR family regulator